MVKRIRRRVDCKLAVEEAMKELGYTVNNRKQEYMQPKECVVLNWSVPFDLETQQSYWVEPEIAVIFTCEDNNSMPFEVCEVIENVTAHLDAENNFVDESTSFYFTGGNFDVLGETTEVTLFAKYQMEKDWVVGI